MLQAALADGRARGLAVSIAVVDAAGVLLAFARLDGAIPMSADVAIGKARAAAAFERATGQLEDSVAQRPALASIPDCILMRGGLPVVLEACVAGAIGTSGASADQDEAISAAALSAIGAKA